MRIRAAGLIVAILIAATVRAHEIGATRVEALFTSKQTYRIRVSADAETLLNRLEVQAGRPRSHSLDAREMERRILQLRLQLARNCSVLFDEQRQSPQIEVHIGADAGGARPVTIELDGAAPPGAQMFGWSYALAYGSYNLALWNEGDPQPARQWLEGDARSRPFPLRQRSVAMTRARVALLYLTLGFTHIVPKGLDHVLFVLGIFLLSTRLRDILSQVTAFTIAHSITLALTMYGLVSLPSRVVEPMIAISIMYVAIENLLTTNIHAWRVLLVFAFGLLHGMGFAGVLREMGLPRSEFLTALLTFNVGVEIGQLSVIAAAALLLASWARHRNWYRARVVVPISFAIAATGLYWTMQRVAL